MWQKRQLWEIGSSITNSTDGIIILSCDSMNTFLVFVKIPATFTGLLQSLVEAFLSDHNNVVIRPLCCAILFSWNWGRKISESFVRFSHNLTLSKFSILYLIFSIRANTSEASGLPIIIGKLSGFRFVKFSHFQDESNFNLLVFILFMWFKWNNNSIFWYTGNLEHIRLYKRYSWERHIISIYSNEPLEIFMEFRIISIFTCLQ